MICSSISRLGNDGRRATGIHQKLSELRIDVFVTTPDKEFDVLNNLQDRSAFIERLRGDLRTVAVVNAIMSPLKDRAETLLELVDRSLTSAAFVGS